MKSAIRRFRAAAQSGPPVPMAPYGYRRGMMFDLGVGKGSRETYLRSYGRSGTVFSIVSLLSQSAALSAWHLYKKAPKDGRVRYTTGDKGSDQRTEVVNHAALSLWNSPNSFHSGFEFREGANQHQELTGETFWVLNREVANFPTSMWYVRPDRMEPVPSPEDYLVGWIYNGPNGEQIPLQLDEVILEKLPDPLDPFRGSGPVASILANIEQQDYATQYQRNLFLNGADPGGLVQVDKRLTDTEFDEFVTRWRESHQGVARAGRVGMLENGATWIPSGQNNKDLEYGNLRQANRDELREAWRMHKAMLGTTEDVNRANAQTAEEVFVSWMTIPRLERRKDTLNTKLLPMFGTSGEGVEFDYEDPSPDNREEDNGELQAKANAAQLLVNAGYDPHDVLEVVGLPDMDVLEKASPIPAVPPGWVVPSGGGSGSDGSPAPAPEPPAGGDGPDAQNRWPREVIRLNAAQPQQDEQWPGWNLDQDTIDYWAPLLAAALGGTMSASRAEQIADAYLAAHPDGPGDGQRRDAVQSAAQWLGSQIPHLPAAVETLVAGMIADGYLIGAASAAAMADGTQADTGQWQPGDTQSAQDQAESLGVGTGMAAQQATASQQAALIADSYAFAMAGVLVTAAATGMAGAAAGAAVVSVLADKAVASKAVAGRVLGAIGTAAKNLYMSRGIQNGMWVTENDAKVDPVCAANQAAGSIQMGSPYPSGDTQPPAHPNCRCVLLPAGRAQNHAELLRRVLNDGYVPVQAGRR